MTYSIRQICALAPIPVDLDQSWIEIMPLGEFRLADKRAKLALNLHPTDAEKIIAASFAAARAGELMIDFDHRSMAKQTVADSRAAGWIKAMKIEGERILASVDWTPEGRAALQGRSYRFISPVFRHLADGRVISIEGAGLVNEPALPQLRQLASKENDMEPIEQIAGLLGLSADKSDDIMARVTALATAETQLASVVKAADVTGDDAVTQICAKLSAKAPDPAAFVPMKAFQEIQTQLASLLEDTNAAKAEAALERARDAGKLVPAMEDWAIQLASKDIEAFEGWAASAPVVVAVGQRQLAGRIPPTRKPDQLTEIERQMASMVGVSETDFLAARNKEG